MRVKKAMRADYPYPRRKTKTKKVITLYKKARCAIFTVPLKKADDAFVSAVIKMSEAHHEKAWCCDEKFPLASQHYDLAYREVLRWAAYLIRLNESGDGRTWPRKRK